MRIPMIAMISIFVAISVSCSSGNEDEESPAVRLREHYENVIVPETELPLSVIAESCDIDGDPDPVACQMFTVLIGDVATARVARYWEAMQWLKVEEPGEEILPAFFSLEDDCETLVIQMFHEDTPEDATGMCGYSRSEQFPPCASGGSGTLEDNVAGFSRCLRLLGE
ncbi:MAG: hypothetical protein WD904_10825 [Dehalococcoidia bacterium]